MTTAGTLLKSARGSSRLSQRDLAARSGTLQPGIAKVEVGTHDPGVENLSRLLAAAGQRLAALPTRARPAAEAAEAISAHLRVHDEERAFREVIQLSDDLAAVTRDIRVALVVTPPALTVDSRYDALVAGVVEHHLRLSRLPVPAWVREPARTLSTPWFVDDNPYTKEISKAEALEVPLRHGVVLAASELASV